MRVESCEGVGYGLLYLLSAIFLFLDIEEVKGEKYRSLPLPKRRTSHRDKHRCSTSSRLLQSLLVLKFPLDNMEIRVRREVGGDLRGRARVES